MTEQTQIHADPQNLQPQPVARPRRRGGMMWKVGLIEVVFWVGAILAAVIYAAFSN